MFIQELKQIILPNEKCTFLVDAGFSIDQSSGLNSVVEIVKILVKL